jgi:hypothetical protein
MAHILIDASNRCTCQCHHTCVLGRFGSSPRCTEEELEKAGYPTIKLKQVGGMISLFTKQIMYKIKAKVRPINI